MFSPADLIVAPATPPGPGMRSIVRIAGAGLEALLVRLVDLESPGLAAAGLFKGRLAFGLACEWGAVEVDILYWPGPNGPVGGPLAELQLPASELLAAAVVTAACGFGSRLAQGGEFTLRAFLAGRLDLVQAEAVLAVVDARSPEELARGLDWLAGGAGVALQTARDGLLNLLADVEAAIDFADETAPDAVPADPAWPLVRKRMAECDLALALVVADLSTRDAAAADLPRVVFRGPPNIGKSSLFNAVSGREMAIVADERGTTRDWLEARLGTEEGGCVLVDLPGLFEPGEVMLTALEAIAADRARHEVHRAAVIIACSDAAAPPGQSRTAGTVPRIRVRTRCDRSSAGSPTGLDLETSALTGAGVAELRRLILDTVAGLPSRGSSATVRLAVGCRAARAELAAAAAAVAGWGRDESIIAGHLRRAAEALADVTGHAINTELLDRIFSRHCIGK